MRRICLVSVANQSFESDTRKKRLRREAAMLFRSRRLVGILNIEKSESGRGSVARVELAFDVTQTLIEDEGEGGFQIEAEVVLEEPRMPAEPMLRILDLRG